MEKEKAKELLFKMASHLKAAQDIMNLINKACFDENRKCVGDCVIGLSVDDEKVEVHIANHETAESKNLQGFKHIKSIELTQKTKRDCTLYPWEFSEVLDGVKFFCLEKTDEE